MRKKRRATRRDAYPSEFGAYRLPKIPRRPPDDQPPMYGLVEAICLTAAWKEQAGCSMYEWDRQQRAKRVFLQYGTVARGLARVRRQAA